MKIKVLGPGCANCKKLYGEVQKAIVLAGIEAKIEKVEKIDEIAKYGVLMTPALVIDEKIKASGRIPANSEIVSWIMTAAANAAT